MPIKVTCPECGQRSKAPDDALGRLARCPRCDQAFLIPAEAPAPEDRPAGDSPDDTPRQ